jgi:hypothetical protein
VGGGEVGQERKEDKAGGATRYAAASHDRFPDFGSRPPGVAALHQCANDSNRPNEGTVLAVVPIEDYDARQLGS